MLIMHSLSCFEKLRAENPICSCLPLDENICPPPISFKQNQSVQCLSIKRTCAFIHLPMTSRKDHPYKKTVCSSKADCQPNYTQNISKYGQTGRNPVRCTSLWLKPNYLLNLCSSLIYNPLFNLYYNIFLLYYYYTHLRLLII